jgi:hypothetical protein
MSHPHHCSIQDVYHEAPCGCIWDLSCVLCSRAAGDTVIQYNPDFDPFALEADCDADD